MLYYYHNHFQSLTKCYSFGHAPSVRELELAFASSQAIAIKEVDTWHGELEQNNERSNPTGHLAYEEMIWRHGIWPCPTFNLIPNATLLAMPQVFMDLNWHLPLLEPLLLRKWTHVMMNWNRIMREAIEQDV